MPRTNLDFGARPNLAHGRAEGSLSSASTHDLLARYFYALLRVFFFEGFGRLPPPDPTAKYRVARRVPVALSFFSATSFRIGNARSFVVEPSSAFASSILLP